MENNFEVIILGGSYAGLSAGMALGRSLRNVLIIDSGKPCNRQTPHSHNFLTHDGKTPSEISTIARAQVEKYNTVKFHDDTVVKTAKASQGFKVETASGKKFNAKKLIVATGVKDMQPDIPGFGECWGISVLHCPYCHGYEVKNETTGILANGDIAYEFSKIILNWTKDLTLFTNGKSPLTDEQTGKLEKNHISINEDEIKELQHENGQIQNIIFKNGKEISLKALYAKIPVEQNLNISEDLGCELTEHGLLKIDVHQKTTVPGVFACGDSTTMMRSVANAVAQGNLAGAIVNKELVDEEFN
ncbi:NAD(P)/FAD-dependent oxidoreductase [Chryseobacterium daecheongense]|uniref:NAD(P)/FAD-dependent oxidoreductase n=1 Tax=Chryseobacterium daecheongense TaxID=192389 RepID=A0A3N0W684_9FLAO|nr:NAD(P)/FAD-dependent oxidoreductase [Chryseobacterium daecheongense]ROI00558.1 NAD(P)/FAD-dependent oxidoreductase [Chryseobacterium daecheongense]TDX94462.1 thioredoxin reductase [Chryseobacterium daecheongense]